MLIDKLHENFPQLPNLRVREITVNKAARCISCVISCPDMSSLDKTVQNDLRAVVYKNVPKGYFVKVTFANDNFTSAGFVGVITEFIKNRFPLFADLKDGHISASVGELSAEATFIVDKFTKQRMEAACFIDELSAYFATYTCYSTRFIVQEDKNDTAVSAYVAKQERALRLALNKELLKPKRYFEVTDVNRKIGKEILAKPMYISDIRNPMEQCVICGKISSKKICSVKNNAILKLCKFDLTDGSDATIACTMFVRFKIEDEETIRQTTTGLSDPEVKTISQKQRASNDKKMKDLMFLVDGEEVLVRGKIVFSQYSQHLEMQMYDISICKIQPIGLLSQLRSSAPQNYALVFPQKIEEYRQLTFEQQEEKPSSLNGVTCVVLYTNSTGLKAVTDKIFAICGIKLVDGHISEKFFTTISPETEISDDKIKETKISRGQLSLSPTLTEIVPDIFKFVQGAVLVGENIAQTVDFLNYYGLPYGYEFLNKTVSEEDVFRRLFEAGNYDEHPSYSQLSEVVKVLKVPCPKSLNCEEVASTVARCMSILALDSV